MASHSSSSNNNNNSSEKRKSALVLTHNFPRYPGDMSGVFLKNLLCSLGNLVDFTVLAPHDGGLPMSETVDGIKVHRFRYAVDKQEILAYRGDMHTRLLSRLLTGWRFMRSYRKSARNLVCEGNFSLIWAHWWVPGGWIGLKAGAGTNIPLVVTCHGTDVFLLDRFPWLRRTASRVFARADTITVVSTWLKERIVAALAAGLNDIEEKAVVAPMPVDSSVFYYDESIKPEPGSIISASRLTPQKNVDKLIRAASMLKRENILFSIDIYGDGPDRPRLDRMITELDLTEQVRLNKPVAQIELAERYRKSQVAVLVSEREGYGLTLPEAMLCGCAAVGARSGGITDIILNDGEDGVLVEPGDADSLYRALKRLLVDNDELRRIRHGCRRSAASRFSDDAVSERFREILRRLLFECH